MNLESTQKRDLGQFRVPWFCVKKKDLTPSFLEDAIYVSAVSQISKSQVREIRTPGSEGVGATIGSSYDPVLAGKFRRSTLQISFHH